MKTEEIVDAARNAGFSSSEIMHRLAAFKRLIQYSTSAEREKCTGTQEFVTLPREVVEQALEALSNTGTQRGKQPSQFLAEGLSINALRAALEQPQNHIPDAWNMVPAGWKLVPVEPTMSMQHAALIESRSHGPVSTGECNALPITYELGASAIVYRAMLDAAPRPPAVDQPQLKHDPLTDEEIADAVRGFYSSDEAAKLGFPDDACTARAIERAHNIK